MGGWDVYCALCAGPFSGIYFKATGNEAASNDNETSDELAELEGPDWNDDLNYNYDDAALPRKYALWINRLQVLGYNPDATGMQKAFLSGLSPPYIEYGVVDVKPGDDSNFPTEQMRDGVVGIPCYEVYNPDDVPGLPCHQVCYKFLERALMISTGKRVVNKETLYNTMIALVKEDGNQRLDIDYGDWGPEPEQYWPCQRGQEVYVADPQQPHDLDAKLRSLPNLGAKKEKLNLWEKVKKDIFSKLPYDLLRMVGSLLPGRDIANLEMASWNVHEADLGNGFWKLNIQKFQPWFWEVETLPEQTNMRALSAALEKWTSHDINMSSLENVQHGVILGLANRKRIWGVAEYIANLYAEAPFDEGAENMTGEDETQWIRDHARNRQMPPVMLPNPKKKKDKKQETCFAVKDWQEVSSGMHFRIFWDSQGKFVGIDLPDKDVLFGTRDVDGGRIDEGSLQPGSWLEALTLTFAGSHSQPLIAEEGEHTAYISGITIHSTSGSDHSFGEVNGPKRVLNVSPGHTFVGFLGQTDPKGISRLGLLECVRPSSRTPSALEDAANAPLAPVSEVEKRLWKDAIPPAGVRALPYSSGYWAPPLPFAFIPQEALMFGTTEDELKRLRRVGVCVMPGGDILMNRERRISYAVVGMAVEVEGETMRVIGQYHEEGMQWFDIDGAGGERITRVGIGMNELAKGIEFTTSFERTSPRYGDPQANDVEEHTGDEAADETIVGIAASFGYPCGYAEDEDGKISYPKKHLRTTSINALVMKLPPVRMRLGG